MSPAPSNLLPGAHSDTELRFVGLGVSPGIARGPLLLGEDVFEKPDLQEIPADSVSGELLRFDEALALTREQIRGLQIQVEAEIGSKDAEIFDAHLLMLEDRTVLDEVRQRIRNRPQQAEGAFYGVMSRYIENLRKIDDDYLRERTLDFEDVARRVVRNLMGKTHGAAHDRPHILLVHELTPSAAASMDRSKVLGLITEAGSHTSHGAIIARSMGIPAVVGLHDITTRFHSGADCLVDGYQGIFILQPSEDTVAEYEVTRRQKSALARHLGEMRDAPAITRDGRSVILSANIEFQSEMPQVTAAGAEGVGLYRTEFFYLNRRDLPGELEQAENYSRVAAAAGPQGVIIRTLDIGGDKLHHHMHRGIEESNPFLGWRGIRVSLTEQDLFKTQLRAALRASQHGRVRLMFPMISGLEELREARRVLAECQQELSAEGIPFDPAVEVGCMIEIPSAAVIADALAREVDFFSIGTNDLIQYTIAVDRGNERVADLYQPCHPAILRLMKSVADASRAAGIWTGVCGEMAGDISLTPLLIGLGFEELSVASVQLPMVKYAIRKLEAAACDQALAEVLRLTDAERIYERIREVSLEYYPELFA
ncbi:MAG: phosphoenolpyruvate--protein phosphotransferase [Verrucomicrobiales bacterium]|nr:phosphoenolpyruvate--protein phosphotransferase [Verrucomicrobiales bacterium]